MKILKSILLLAAFAVAIPLHAQVPVNAAVTILTGGTNNVVGAATNSYRAAATVRPVIDVSYQKDFGYQIVFKHNGAATNAYTFVFDTSVDGTSWRTNTTSVTVVGNAFSATATNVVVTNVNNAGVPYYRLGEIWSTNDAAIIATNLSLKYNARMLVP